MTETLPTNFSPPLVYFMEKYPDWCRELLRRHSNQMLNVDTLVCVRFVAYVNNVLLKKYSEKEIKTDVFYDRNYAILYLTNNQP